MKPAAYCNKSGVGGLVKPWPGGIPGLDKHQGTAFLLLVFSNSSTAPAYHILRNTGQDPVEILTEVGGRLFLPIKDLKPTLATRPKSILAASRPPPTQEFQNDPPSILHHHYHLIQKGNRSKEQVFDLPGEVRLEAGLGREASPDR